MFVKTEWLYDANGKSTDQLDAPIIVRGFPKSEAEASAGSLRPPVEALYAQVLAQVKNPLVTPVTATQSAFEAKTGGTEQVEGGGRKTPARHQLFFVYFTGVGAAANGTKLLGYSRVFEEPLLNAVITAPIIVDPTLTSSEQEAVQRALFHATERLGRKFTQEMLRKKRAKAELEGVVPLPASQPFYRSLFAAMDFTKKLLADDGFVEGSQRLEMAKELTSVAKKEVAFVRP